ncbi:MAG: PilC/PilY family type IV pilus protein [Candidatus Eutrophobiaceae bacterium]
MKKTLHLTLALCLCITAGSARADDTDIYFSRLDREVTESSILGKVLFILDTSGSMAGRTVNGITKAAALRDAFREVIHESTNIAVGLFTLRFGETSWDEGDLRGGALRFPMKSLDLSVDNIVGDAIGDTEITFSLASTNVDVPVIDPDDSADPGTGASADAQEINGVVDTTSSTLLLPSEDQDTSSAPPFWEGSIDVTDSKNFAHVLTTGEPRPSDAIPRFTDVLYSLPDPTGTFMVGKTDSLNPFNYSRTRGNFLVLRYDDVDLPPGAIITSAKFILWQTNTDRSTYDGQLAISELGFSFLNKPDPDPLAPPDSFTPYGSTPAFEDIFVFNSVLGRRELVRRITYDIDTYNPFDPNNPDVDHGRPDDWVPKRKTDSRIEPRFTRTYPVNTSWGTNTGTFTRGTYSSNFNVNWKVEWDISSVMQQSINRGCTVDTDGTTSNCACASGTTTGLTNVWCQNNAMMLFVGTAHPLASFFYVDAAARFRTFVGNAEYGRNVENTDKNAKGPTIRVEYLRPTGGSKPLPAEIYTGLHYQNINIPKNATIVSANLIVSAAQNSNQPSIWRIHAHDVSNSRPFVNGKAKGISQRPLTTAYYDWNVPAMSENNSYSTDGSSLVSVIQEIVDRNNWCGGNDLSLIIKRPPSGTHPGNHEIVSLDGGDPGQAPKLRIEFEAQGGNCRKTERATRIQSATDDAVQNSASGSDILLTTDQSITVGPNNSSSLGLRFVSASLKPEFSVVDSKLSVHLSSKVRRRVLLRIYGAAQRDIPTFDPASPSAITDFPLTSQSVNWTIPVGASGTVESPDISQILEELTDISGWSSQDSVTLVIKNRSAANTLSISAYDSLPRQAPLLNMVLKNTETIPDSGPIQVRSRLVEIVDSLYFHGQTPLLGMMAEVASYWMGGKVVIGTQAGQFSPLTHPGGYCVAGASVGATPNCRNAAAGLAVPRTNEYGATIVDGCNEWDPYSLACSNRRIISKAGTQLNYLSPFEDLGASSSLDCAIGDHQVLMTDGRPQGGNLATAIPYAQQVFRDGLGIDLQCRDVPGEGDCLREIAEALATRDLDSDLTGVQGIKTHTIAFSVSPSEQAETERLLKGIARKGQGSYYTSESKDELVDIFRHIFDAARASSGSSFVSPALATNAFNRLLSRDETYFGLFTPTNKQSWYGNIKKFSLCISSQGTDPDDPSDDCTLGNILDRTGSTAINSVDGRFLETSQSHWGPPGVEDGGLTVKGGAGALVVDWRQEIIYSDVPLIGDEDGAIAAGIITRRNQNLFPNTSLAPGNSGYIGKTDLTADNWDDADRELFRNGICGEASADTDPDSDCAQYIEWLLGRSIVANPSDTSESTETRWSMADVLHSSPVIITYGGNESSETFYDRIATGTNDGALHFINANTGEREWRFYPYDLLQNTPALFNNAVGERIYGMDQSPTVHIIDQDKDGVIEVEDNDAVRLYLSMRRGGNQYYALDVSPNATWDSDSNTISPSFLWRITKDNAYSRLAQTWSQPQIARLRSRSGPKNVLIFGGGYDERLDDGDYLTQTGGDNLGNAIYFADAETGEKLFSISKTGSENNILHAFMRYSIPSEVSLLDSDGDGFHDRLYVGDTGGQIWRVDIGIGLPNKSQEGTIVGRFASVGDPSATGSSNNARRFFERLSILQVRDTQYSRIPGGEYDYILGGTGDRSSPKRTDVRDRFYAIRDSFVAGMPDADGGGQADPRYDHLSRANHLIDITNQNTGFEGATGADLENIKNSAGWYYDFNTAGVSGEKVLSRPTTIAGTVYFTSYAPIATSANACNVDIGQNFAYNFDLFTGKVSVDWDTSDGTPYHHRTDRKFSLGEGIPSNIVPVFTKEGVVGLVGVEGGVKNIGVLSELPRYITYWYEDLSN